MIYTKDPILSDCYPSSVMTWEEFLEDCEKAVNIFELQSDEWSSSDEDLANDERDNGKRPDNILNTNSVIKVHNKRWRSTRVCKVWTLFFKNNLYNDNIIYFFFIIRLEKYYLVQKI